MEAREVESINVMNMSRIQRSYLSGYIKMGFNKLEIKPQVSSSLLWRSPEINCNVLECFITFISLLAKLQLEMKLTASC
jgi:hypothetical protein